MDLIDESKLPTLRQFDKIHRKEILFLHILLNHHLPDGDRLPMEDEDGQFDFGPRTLKKVQLFQEVNKIDFGTTDFKDGIVGKKTWAKLTEKAQVDLTITTPPLRIPPSIPIPGLLPPLILPPIPNNTGPTPLPRPKIFSLQLQIGQQGQFPFDGPASASHAIQVTGVMLLRKDKGGTEFEGQISNSVNFNRGGKPGDSKTDAQFGATLNVTKLPGSFGRFSWSTQVTAAIMRSLNKFAPPQAQASAGVGVTLTVIQVGGTDVLQVTGGGGLYVQAEPPGNDNEKWKVTGGATAFFGITGTIGSF